MRLHRINQPDPPLSTSASTSSSKSSAQSPLDPLTARTYLTSALAQFLGITGTSISIDILKIENYQRTSSSAVLAPSPVGLSTARGSILWIRVPHDDAAAVIAAVSSWIGTDKLGSNGSVAWKVLAKGSFLNSLVGGGGSALFAP